MLEQHFSGACRVCPMSGKRAPELVDGKLEEVLQASWSQTDIKVSSFGASRSLTHDQLELLRSEMLRAKAIQVSLLQAKCDYLKRLPWLLMGLAVRDESRARNIAQRCIEAFEKEPSPPPVQHRLTWQLLSRDLHFVPSWTSSLQALLDGSLPMFSSSRFQLGASSRSSRQRSRKNMPECPSSSNGIIWGLPESPLPTDCHFWKDI